MKTNNLIRRNSSLNSLNFSTSSFRTENKIISSHTDPFDTVPETINLFNIKDSIMVEFDFIDLDSISKFFNEVSKNIVAGERYILYTKLKHNTNQFKMLGDSIGFVLEDGASVEVIRKGLLDRLFHSMDKYQIYLDEINVIRLIIRKVSSK